MKVLREYAAAAGQPRLLPSTSHYDEVASPDGTLRQAWRRLAAESGDIELDDLRRIGGEIDRALTDDGVVYRAPGSRSRSWRLDPVPIVIEADEWSTLERGLTQRTELLNAILVDLYGEQKLLSQRLLPPAVVFGHAGFKRVVARASAHDDRPLLVTAADLGRMPDGSWRVLADRVQAPSGIGFAMENRRVLSRVLPEVYRGAVPHRIAPFFQALRQTLLGAAPDGIEDPRVVVLSPGPMSETAYDQSTMATRLGFPLVEGSDLTVQDGHVYMRVLGRLERVDVILRRVDAEWSDPLELRGDSRLGVAGLTEAVRRGNVRVVNGLGAGVLENPALVPYMERLCEHLLDERLRLPSMPTWWAGEPDHRELLFDRIDELVIRDINRPGRIVRGSADHVRQLLTADPLRYVGQERPTLSVSPTLDTVGLVSHEVRLRTFTMWYGSSYRPLIGGLATSRREHLSSLGISKDVWVLKGSAAEPDQGLTDLVPITPARAPVAMGPRFLDDLFWFGRYRERLEDSDRLLIAAHGLAQDFLDRPSTIGGQTMQIVTAALESLSPSGLSNDLENFTSFVLDESRVGSIGDTLASLRRVSQGVRDYLSQDLFRVFGAIDRAIGALQANPHSAQLGESAGRILTDALAISGVTANMMRDAGWRLMRVGSGLERGLQLTRLIRALLIERNGIDVEREVLNVLLASSESLVTHSRRYRGAVRVANVLDLLLLDPDNPRSLHSSLEHMQEHLVTLPGSTGSTRPERLVEQLLARLAEVDLTALAAVDGATRPDLVEFTDHVERQLRSVSDAVAVVHFPAGPAQRSIGFNPVGV